MAASGLAALVALAPELLTEGPTLCPFRRATGVPCPGCGLTRSVVAVLRGDLAAAIEAHPFGPVVLLAGVVHVARLLRRRAGVAPQPWWTTVGVPLGAVPTVAGALLATVWLGWYATRLA